MFTLYERNGNPVRVPSLETKTVSCSKCRRCGGVGRIPQFNFVDGGRCFGCAGTGHSTTHHTKVYTKEHIAKLDESLAKRRAKKEAIRLEKLEANKGPALEAFKALDIYEFVVTNKDGNEFLENIHNHATSGSLLTERQIDAVKNVEKSMLRKSELDAAKEKQANAIPLTEGRQVIEGVVVSVKDIEDRYSYVEGAFIRKVLVKLECRNVVWMTAPSSLKREIKRGDELTVTVTISASKDKGFYIGKRPSKASIKELEEA